MKSLLGGFVVMVLCVLAIASVSFAQLPTGTILGVVKDNSGGVVPGVTVTIRNVETDLTRTLTTSDDGAFRVPALPVGHYAVKFEKDNFKTETQTGLVLDVSQELVLNTSLQVGASTQEVTVTGEAPVVNTTNGTLGGLVNEEKMADLPLNGRNWVDLTLLQPGISQQRVVSGVSPVANTGTFFSSNGASIRSNNYMLDGAMMVTLYGVTQSSVSGATLGVEGIREYKVVTNSFSAEYGLSAGSQTTLVSKSGSNVWHGSAFEYLRNSVLDARNPFDTDIAAGKTLSGAQRRLPEFQRNNFGGSFGGPAIKDKTFFFAVFEGVQEQKGLSLLGTTLGDGTNNTLNCRALTANPCGATGGKVSAVMAPLLGMIPSGTVGAGSYYFALPNVPNPAGAPKTTGQFSFPVQRRVSEQYGQIRLDQTFSVKDTAFARYTINRAALLQPNFQNPNPALYDHPYNTAQFTTVSETHIFTSNLLNTARFSISRTPLENTSPTPDYPAGGALVSFIPGFPQFGLGTISITGLTSFSADLQLHHDQKIYAISDDVFWTKGRHSLKFGTLITNWKQRMELQGSLRGSLAFSNLANFLNGVYNSYSGNTPGSNVRRDYTYGTLGFYVQDDMRLKPRLTVNAGLRYEIMDPNYYEVNHLDANLRDIVNDTGVTAGQTFKNPSLKAFSPRLGFAWDIFGDGKTALRGGGALLYDIGNMGAGINQAAAGTPPASSQSTITANTACATNNFPAAGPVVPIPFFFPACALGKTLAIMDYNMKQARIYGYNLTVDRQLPWGIGLSVGYAGSRGNDIYNREEGNACKPTSIANQVSNWANPTNTACPLGRVNSAFSNITFICACSDSWYNSLQILATKRVTHGLQFQSTYTYGKNLDDGNGQQPGDMNTLVTDPQFRKIADRGRAAYDATHNFRFNLIYNVPKTSYKGFVGGALNGWWVSTITSLQSGYPITPLLGSNRSLSGALGGGGGIDRPDLAPGRSLDSITNGVSISNGIDPCPTAGQPLGTTALWFDPCAFLIPKYGSLGNVGRSTINGPGLANVDFSVVKDTPFKYIGESGQVQFRVEMFNIVNHPNLFNPNGAALNIYSASSCITSTGASSTSPAACPMGAGAVESSVVPTSGQIQTTTTSSRQLQLALKVTF